MLPKEKLKLVLRKAAADVLHYSGVDRLLQSHKRPHWRILTYHRCIYPQELSYPLQPGIFVSPQTFALHMQFLATHCKVISLDELVAKIAAKEEIQPRTVAISFDDGWKDTYSNAFPILREHKLPATVFLSTSFVGTNEISWTDKLIIALNSLRHLPQHHKHLSATINENINIDRQICANMLQFIIEKDSSIIPSYIEQIIDSLKKLPYPARNSISTFISNLAKEWTTIKYDRSFMNWTEVETMSKNNISFGSHSHLHQHYTELSPAHISEDLCNSFQILKEKGLTASKVFCYPGGYYNEQTQQILAEKQIHFALSATRQSNLSIKPMILGRISIHEDVANSIPLFVSRVWAEQIF